MIVAKAKNPTFVSQTFIALETLQPGEMHVDGEIWILLSNNFQLTRREADSVVQQILHTGEHNMAPTLRRPTAWSRRQTDTRKMSLSFGKCCRRGDYWVSRSPE